MTSQIEEGTRVRKWALHSWKGVVLRVLDRDAGTPYVEAQVRWHEPNKKDDYCLLSSLEEDVIAFGEQIQVRDIQDGTEAYMSGKDGEGSVWVHMKVKLSQVVVPTG